MTQQPSNGTTIQVMIKNVYGNEKVYPICERAKIFAKMVGQTTLTDFNLKYIKELGYTIQVVSQYEAEL